MVDRTLTFRNRAASQSATHRNVGNLDRWISGVLGGLMLTRTPGRKTGLGKVASLTAGTMLLTRAATGHSQMYEMLGVSSATLEQGAGINIEGSITVNRPLEELYQYWRDVTNLPGVLRDVQSVEMKPNGTSHWTVKGPGRMTVSWDAEIINDHPNELIAWRSVEGSRIEHSGSVHFRPAVAGQGTEVHLKMRYVPPGGIYGFGAAKVLNNITEQQLMEDLRGFKRMMETRTTPRDMAARTLAEDAPGMSAQVPERTGQTPSTVAPSMPAVHAPGATVGPLTPEEPTYSHAPNGPRTGDSL